MFTGKIDLTEFNKLEQLLKEAGIPYERVDERSAPDVIENDIKQYGHSFAHYEIFYPSVKNHISDAVIFYGSYGIEDGLLEQMGLLPPNATDSVQGWLTAEEIFNRWKEHFEKGKNNGIKNIAGIN